LRLSADATDEAMLAEQAGYVVRVVDGDPRNLKITTPDDLTMAESFVAAPTQLSALRIGNGYDLHRLAAGRPLILGGVRFPVGQVDIGAEVRHQSGEGKLDPLDFAGGSKVDLGGFSYLATFNIRF
jgi:hypothetical protein